MIFLNQAKSTLMSQFNLMSQVLNVKIANAVINAITIQDV
jgi:hypothetical protein